MDICFLLPPAEYYSPKSGGAVATIAMQHASNLLSRGHSVKILADINGDELYPVGDILPIKSMSKSDLSLAQRGLSRLRRHYEEADLAYYEYYRGSFVSVLNGLASRPDAVVVFNDLVSPIYVKRALPGTKVIVNLQNEQRTRRKDVSATIDSVHTFVACSQYIRKWTGETYNIPAEKLAVINNGVDLDQFRPRQDYLVSQQPLRVLFVGRIDRNKGPDIAADAIASLQKEGIPIRLTVAGGLWFYGHGNEMSDPFFRELRVKMDAVGAEYLGYVTRDKVAAVVREHDVVCVLSRSHDPNPLVCLEAMASGCAVIGADRGGIPDAVEQVGLLVDPDDFPAVVDSLRKLATSADTLRIQKEKSYLRALQASWSATVDKFQEVLQRQ